MKKFLQSTRKNPKKVLMIVSICAFMCFMLAITTSATGNAGLENVGTVSSFLWSEIGQVVTTIVSTPLLLIPVGIFVAGAAIGLAKRFIGR